MSPTQTNLLLPLIVTLTTQGKSLAKRVQSTLGNIEHQHRPKPFGVLIQTAFLDGRPIIGVCATSIMVRVLGPVLKDKTKEPPVLVLDQTGKFIIPLLGAHEAGANAWAAQLASRLGATTVCTTANLYLTTDLPDDLPVTSDDV